MTTFALMPWRRVSAQGGLWNLFAWFGRACDQAAGILVSPIIVAVFARSVQADPYRLSWLVVGFGLGWLIGAAIAPLLQQVTVRIMPWIVGGYIVRTAAIVLMTFAVTDDQSSQTQRFQSILICYVAYAIATGISRTAQARHVIVGAPHNLWDARSLPASLGSAAVTAIAALAMWSALSSSDLSWSASFGRIWILASVALGVATLAAIREGIEMPEMAADSHRRATQSDAHGQVGLSGASAFVVAGLASMTFVEVVAFLLLFDEFRRQTIYLRGGLAFFAAGWVIARLIWNPVRHQFGRVVIAQAAVGCAAIGIIVATATPELTQASWFPDQIGNRSSAKVLIYAVGLLIGAGFSVQRMALADFFDSSSEGTRWMALAVSALACLSPLIVGWASGEFAKNWVLVGGIVLAMAVMATLGLMPGTSPAYRASTASAAPMRQALLPRQ
ncbi:MAG TPA: hypothetical protein VEQ36_00860 [Thermomicrobiales bacterium]|nr:hypothetical protein [Thermomicrobiales bacterium]